MQGKDGKHVEVMDLFKPLSEIPEADTSYFQPWTLDMLYQVEPELKEIAARAMALRGRRYAAKRAAYDESPIVKTIKKLLEQSPEHRWDGTAKDLMEAGKYIARAYLAVDNQKLGYAIRDLEKPLFDFDGIVHSSGKTSGNGGKMHHFYYQDLGQFEELGEQEKIPWADT